MIDEAEQIDSSIDIVTPENIAIQYTAAGFSRRLLAFLIDLAIKCMVIIAVGFVAMFAGIVAGPLAGAALIVFWFILDWFYSGLFETYWNGQTPGKRSLGIRVLRTDGQPITGMQAISRNILRYVDLMPLIDPFGVGRSVFPLGLCGILTPMLNRRNQRLGDLVCGTIVVIEEKQWLFKVAKVEDPRARQLAEYLPANYVVPRDLARALATYVERRKFFSTARRREIARHLGVPLLEIFNLPRDTSHDLLLCALYYQTFVVERNGKEPPPTNTVGLQTPHAGAPILTMPEIKTLEKSG